ncbi:unnamed protein product [Discosporangium mesarthrocarpum]
MVNVLRLAPFGVLALKLGLASAQRDFRLLIPFYVKPLFPDTPVAGPPDTPFWTEEEAFMDSKYWDDVEQLGYLEAGVTVVVNPRSGPFHPDDTTEATSLLRPLYAERIPPLKQAGIEILCYVFTSFGMRSTTEVETDIGLYAEPFYFVDPVDDSLLCDGIFFDEVSGNETMLPLYQSYWEKAQNKFSGSSVVLNPGSLPGSGAPGLYDIGGGTAIITSLENSYSTLQNSTTPGEKEFPPASNASSDSSQHSTIIHTIPSGVSNTQIYDLVESAYCNNWGHIFLTDDVLIPNPFDKEPAFLLELPMAIQLAKGSSCSGLISSQPTAAPTAGPTTYSDDLDTPGPTPHSPTSPFLDVVSPGDGEIFTPGRVELIEWEYESPVGKDDTSFSVDLYRCAGGDCGGDGCGTFVKSLCKLEEGCSENENSFRLWIPLRARRITDTFAVRVGMIGEDEVYDCSGRFTVGRSNILQRGIDD